MSDADRYHETRFAPDPKREILWRTLCDRFFNGLIPLDAHVVDLGAGHGSFINNVRARRRTAVDIWPGLQSVVVPGVDVHVGDVTDLSFLADRSVDFAFASNIFEHVSQLQFARVLEQLRMKLTLGGTLNILQPNFRYCASEYFDDYTHISIWSHVSICDFLAANGFEVSWCHPRFLPLTIKSRMPVFPIAIRAYLASPWRPLGKQMLIRARMAGSK